MLSNEPRSYRKPLVIGSILTIFLILGLVNHAPRSHSPAETRKRNVQAIPKKYSHQTKWRRCIDELEEQARQTTWDPTVSKKADAKLVNPIGEETALTVESVKRDMPNMDWARWHKSVPLADERNPQRVALVYDTNTVVTVDVDTCAVTHVFMPRKDGKMNPRVAPQSGGFGQPCSSKWGCNWFLYGCKYGICCRKGTCEDGRRTIVIRSKMNGKAIDVPYGARNVGAELQMYSYFSATNEAQHFWVWPDGFVTDPNGKEGTLVQNVASKLLWDIRGGGQNNGDDLIQWDGPNGAHGRFFFLKVGEFWKIQVEHTGKVIDIDGFNNANGAKLHQWDFVGGVNQLWTITFL